MRLFGLCVSLAVLLGGCGGGGGDGGSGDAGTVAGTAAVDASSASSSGAVCGYDVGPYLFSGVVSGVHDGDTITVDSPAAGSVKVRLDSIDAPELAQPFGPQAQNALTGAVLGRSVQVAYGKTDQYGRVVGAVFTNACLYVNLYMVASGEAWYYKAYQCEISAPTRSLFAQAQASASQAGFGLWSQSSPEAPWFYRNGTEPATPTCSSTAASWAGSLALSSSTATVLPGSTLTSTPISVSAGSTAGGTAGSGSSTPSTPTCYVGPRGGTYTITASGNKNYGGC